MNVVFRLFAAGLAAASAGVARGAEPWSEVRLGMSAEQAAAVLGEPLLRSGGFGFEIWTYDHCGEVVFYGPLVGWTEPAKAGRAGKSVDVWQARADSGEAPGFFLPRPVKVPRAAAGPTRAMPTPGPSSVEASWLPRYRPRSRL